jgi:hypothetical protein
MSKTLNKKECKELEELHMRKAEIFATLGDEDEVKSHLRLAEYYRH